MLDGSAPASRTCRAPANEQMEVGAPHASTVASASPAAMRRVALLISSPAVAVLCLAGTPRKMLPDHIAFYHPAAPARRGGGSPRPQSAHLAGAGAAATTRARPTRPAAQRRPPTREHGGHGRAFREGAALQTRAGARPG